MVFVFLSKNLLRLKNSRTLISAQNSKLGFRIFSAVSSDKDDASKDYDFTISYLVDSCGLTREAATRARKIFQIKSAERADTVLNLFRRHGVRNKDLSRLIVKRPQLLVADPDRTLRPKLELLASLGGARQEVLVRILLRCPELLCLSMEKNLCPSVEFLRCVLGNDEALVKLLSRCSRLLWSRVSVMIGDKFVLLRELGMPDKKIVVFFRGRTSAFLTSAAKFRGVIDKVSEMGFDIKKSSFTEAADVFLALSEATWEKKVGILKKWGWSDAQVVSAFKKQPRCMITSEKKIVAIMDYLMNTVELNPSFASDSPNVLMCSLENRIIPRCSTVQYLISKGVLKRKDSVFSSALLVSEVTFLSLFVKKYIEFVPDLLDIYARYQKQAKTQNIQPVLRLES